MSEVYEIPYPFYRDKVILRDDEGSHEISTWVPGVRYVFVPPDESEAVADALGAQLIDVVSRHKPGRFPERVFYTRKWRDPDGNEFGKPVLRVKTGAAFKRLVSGYRYDYRLLSK